MAFPQTVETLGLGTNLSTIVNESEWNPPRTLLNKIQAITVGPVWKNAIGEGADPTGVADSSAVAIATIAAMGPAGGTLYWPPGLYRMDTLVKVPSLVTIQGAGMYATKFFAPASSADIYMFEVATITENTQTNVYSQVYGVTFKDFEIRDRASSDTLKLQSSGRSEDHHGILIHDSDWSIMSNVNFRDLQGCAINMSNVVREWYVENVYVQNCGDAAETIPSVDIGSTSGDATNTIYFIGLRVAFPTYIGLRINGAQDGTRLINFVSCQIEGGGNGSAGSYGNPHDYDLVYLGLMVDVAFVNCNFSNPGPGEWCIDADGSATSRINRIDISNCKFNGNGSGGGVRANRIDEIVVQQVLFEGSTVGCGDFYVETTAGIIQVSLDTTYSTNPTAGSPLGHFRGRTGVGAIDLRDNAVDFSGGGIVPAYSSGQPPANLNLPFTAPNGMMAYDTANDILWYKRAGIWVPMAGQVVYRDGEAGFFGSSAENTMLSYSIPANFLHATGGLQIKSAGYFNTGGGAATVTLRIKLGGVTLFSSVSASMALDADNTVWYLDLELRNVGATNVQRAYGLFAINAAVAPSAGQGAITTDEIITMSPIGFAGTADMTAAQTIAVTLQLSTARDNIRTYSRAMIVS